MFLLLMILFNLYVSSCITLHISYFDSIIKILYYPYYYVVFLLLVFAIIAKTYHHFKSNYVQIIRYSNHVNCIKYILRQIVFNISMCFVINLLMLLIGLNLFHFFNIGFSITINGVNILIYSIFLILRFYIFCIIFSILSFLLLNILHLKTTLVINSIAILTIPNYLFFLPSITINGGNSMPLFYLGFFNSISFSNFTIELCATVGHILVLLILCLLLYNYNIYKKRLDFE